MSRLDPDHAYAISRDLADKDIRHQVRFNDDDTPGGSASGYTIHVIQGCWPIRLTDLQTTAAAYGCHLELRGGGIAITPTPADP